MVSADEITFKDHSRTSDIRCLANKHTSYDYISSCTVSLIERLICQKAQFIFYVGISEQLLVLTMLYC